MLRDANKGSSDGGSRQRCMFLKLITWHNFR